MPAGPAGGQRPSRQDASAPALVIALSCASSLFAQSPSEVLYRDDCQSYGTQQNPPRCMHASAKCPRRRFAGRLTAP